ncbi:hypothetical protein [Anabaena sp. UHCC 0204]|uniref:hypothetical protein n=1 Tax=Anabaena sp. UHCC 0204 TaxID=2590009 RepID=UPI001445818C|nr:hypothetical protein [Anabaena sp. UHCC 0204]MTJ08615.1 hypothetical protein [Anabaena sp. UHCC 0204]
MIKLDIDRRIFSILPLILLLLTPLLVAATPIYTGQIFPNPWIWEILKNVGIYLYNSAIGQIILQFGNVVGDVVIHTIDGGRDVLIHTTDGTRDVVIHTIDGGRDVLIHIVDGVVEIVKSNQK